LRPGGLACIGYNVATGWAPITPVGHLLRLLTEGHPAARGDVGAAIGLLEKLRDGGAEYLKRNPAAAAAVGSLSRSSRAYVTHHYMAENWRPQMFPQVADDMVRARCAYIASANLTDNFPVTSVPGALIPMLNEAAEPRLREAIRDFASAKGFRRDLFGRGPEPLHASEQRSLLCDTLFAGLGTRPEGAVPIPCSLGVAQGPADLYQPLLAALEKGPMPWGQALAASPLSARRFTESIEAVGMLMAGGYIHPAWPAASAAAGRLNAEIVRLSRAGEVLNCLSAPALGAGMVAQAAEVLAYGALLDGVPADATSLALALKATLRQSGRAIAQGSSGAAPTAWADTTAEPEAGLARSLLASRLPALQRLCVGVTLDQS
jgi:hypothetical protein